jgi:hypothetical protein
VAERIARGDHGAEAATKDASSPAVSPSRQSPAATATTPPTTR